MLTISDRLIFDIQSLILPVIAAAVSGVLLLLASIRLQARLSVDAATKHSKWLLTSGKRASEYFDIDELSLSPEQLRELSYWYANKIEVLRKDQPGVNYLAFLEKDSGPVGAITMAGLITMITRIPSIVIRNRRDITAGLIKPSSVLVKAGSSPVIIIVSDVATSGRNLVEAQENLKSIWPEARIPYAIVWIDRQDGATAALEKVGIQLVARERIKIKAGRPRLRGAPHPSP